MVEAANRFIISAKDANTAVPEEFYASAEVVFFFDGKTELNFPEEWRKPLYEHLSHCIARNPKDLRSHVRRILLEKARNSNQGLFASLIDLFLVLENKGLSLRQRMLHIAQDSLTEEQNDKLEGSLARGLQPTEYPELEWCILCQGILGTRSLVLVKETTIDQTRDPLVEAREYLEYSQLDNARILLEQAILAAPERIDLHMELLDIFRLTQDNTRCKAMIAKLKGLENPMIDKWEKLVLSFEDKQ